jgi:hypothetical protein
MRRYKRWAIYLITAFVFCSCAGLDDKKKKRKRPHRVQKTTQKAAPRPAQKAAPRPVVVVKKTTVIQKTPSTQVSELRVAIQRNEDHIAELKSQLEAERLRREVEQVEQVDTINKEIDEQKTLLRTQFP